MFLIKLINLRGRPEMHNLYKLMCADKTREATNISSFIYLLFVSLIIILEIYISSRLLGYSLLRGEDS